MSMRTVLAVAVAVAALALFALAVVTARAPGGEGGDAPAGGTAARGAPADSAPATGGAPADGGSPTDESATGAPGEAGAAAAGRNLLSADQHSFERSAEGWTPQGNTTLARDTAVALVGAASLAVTVDDSGPWPDGTRTARAGTSPEPEQLAAVEPGARYRASWQILTVAPLPARCELRWYGEGGRIITTEQGEAVTATPGSWTPAECAGTAPAGTVGGSVRVHVSEADYGTVFHVDDVWLVETAPAATAAAPSPGAASTPAPGAGQAGDPTREAAASGGPYDIVQGSGDDPRHGEDVGAGNTGPTAFHDEELGRRLTYDDLEPSETITTTHDGQVIERKDVAGEIRIAHDDVVVRAVRVRNQGSRYSISYVHESGARGAELSYVEIDGNEDPDNIAVLLDHFTLHRSHVYGQSTGVVFGSGSTIEYSYVHSQALKPGSHNAAMAIHGGSDVSVRFNNLVGSTSSALSLYPRLAPLVDIVVEGNLFNGGSYCAYAGGGGKEYADQGRGIRFVGNKFGSAMHADCGHYGPVTNMPGGAGSEWRENTWQVTGDPVG